MGNCGDLECPQICAARIEGSCASRGGFRRAPAWASDAASDPADHGAAICPSGLSTSPCSIQNRVSRFVQSCAISILTGGDPLELFESTSEMALIRVPELKSDLGN
jgi:hypothetical protein